MQTGKADIICVQQARFDHCAFNRREFDDHVSSTVRLISMLLVDFTVSEVSEVSGNTFSTFCFVLPFFYFYLPLLGKLVPWD